MSRGRVLGGDVGVPVVCRVGTRRKNMDCRISRRSVRVVLLGAGLTVSGYAKPANPSNTFAVCRAPLSSLRGYVGNGIAHHMIVYIRTTPSAPPPSNAELKKGKPTTKAGSKTNIPNLFHQLPTTALTTPLLGPKTHLSHQYRFSASKSISSLSIASSSSSASSTASYPYPAMSPAPSYPPRL